MPVVDVTDSGSSALMSRILHIKSAHKFYLYHMKVSM